MMSATAQPAVSDQPRPLRRDAEQNRQRILAAAREVYSERGLDVTLDDIARHAGVGVGTVYRRFPGKEALIDALFEDKVNSLLSLAEEALANLDP
jgi:AcrR family transcriptional regulator